MTEQCDLLLTYEIVGNGAVVPPRASPKRRDGLWAHTCFELFARQRGQTSYLEFNFCPSGEWAAYSFDAYRSGASDLVMAVVPCIDARHAQFRWDVDLELTEFSAGGYDIGLSAIIEEANGTKSYWALIHPNPAKPDFHDPACFTLQLPPPPRA